MQKIQSLEHAQRILRQREVHEAQVHQLLEFVLARQVAVEARAKGIESLQLAVLEFTRLTMTHLEKTGHHEDEAVKEALQRVVAALQRVQSTLAPAKADEPGAAEAEGN